MHTYVVFKIVLYRKLKSLLQEGRTALYLAAENNHKEAVDILLDYTASANAHRTRPSYVSFALFFPSTKFTSAIGCLYVSSQGTLLVELPQVYIGYWVYNVLPNE